MQRWRKGIPGRAGSILIANFTEYHIPSSVPRRYSYIFLQFREEKNLGSKMVYDLPKVTEKWN